ncbi:YIP1 family protein [Labrys monachus]|uniref:Yip1 domain-containing protein n=1 Tax=Labrys monachus TaxID=217067 RepID=A0ABU0FKX9_9HYPH|nr:YIP1 family protein [Labrys monachus]MDQ0394743.1 hypothetical protein [Labrys monachus]
MDVDIVERARNILLRPAAEWPVIASEATSVETIYRDYVVYLAAVPPVAGFVGLSLLGPFGVFGTLFWAVASYVLSLFVVYVMALVVNALAPSFEGRPGFLDAFKLTAYSMTAAWVAGIFALVPILGIFGLLLSLYSIYLFYIGAPVLMRSPASRSLIYTVAVVVAGVVVQAIAGAILRHLFLRM